MDSRVCHPYNEDVTDKTVNRFDVFWQKIKIKEGILSYTSKS
jgi:hypothetical protein